LIANQTFTRSIVIPIDDIYLNRNTLFRKGINVQTGDSNSVSGRVRRLYSKYVDRLEVGIWAKIATKIGNRTEII
jgi:hypothetical protein